jgi:Putative viral replication protein.
MVKCKHYAMIVWPNHLNNKFASVQEFFEYAKDRTAGVKYLVMQLEVAPTTKQVHVQGFITFQQQKTPATAANFFGGIDKEVFQKMKKGATPWDNKVYCTKEDSRLPGCVPFEYGEVPQPGEKPAADESRLEAFIKAMEKDGLNHAMDNDPSTYVRSHSGLDKLAGIYQGRKIPQMREVTVYVAGELHLVLASPLCTHLGQC